MTFIILKKTLPGISTAYVCAGGEKAEKLLADGWTMDLTNGGLGYESEKDAWTYFARCEPGEVSEGL
jgi:hypothetical protein